MKTPRKTHPEAPLYFPEQPDLTPDQQGQISVDFSQLTGQASDPQVPQSAVVQHEAALALSFTQMTDNPTAPQKAAVLASAALTGTPTAPTAAVGTNTTQVATTAFVLANSSSSAPSRGDVAVTTAALANNATEQGTIALGKSSLVLRFTGSVKCRLRLYSTAAYRTADVSRAPGIDPIGEHGIMLDILLPTGNLTWDLSPLSLVTNGDGSPSSNIYYAIQNLSGGTVAITATLSRILLEA